MYIVQVRVMEVIYRMVGRNDILGNTHLPKIIFYDCKVYNYDLCTLLYVYCNSIEFLNIKIYGSGMSFQWDQFNRRA